MKLYLTFKSKSFKWDINEIIFDSKEILDFCETSSSYILRMNVISDLKKYIENLELLYSKNYNIQEISNFKKELDEIIN